MLKKRFIPIFLLFSAGLFAASCSKEGDYNLDDFNTDNVVIKTGLQCPLVRIQITFKDLFTMSGVNEQTEAIEIENPITGEPEKIHFTPEDLERLINEFGFETEGVDLAKIIDENAPEEYKEQKFEVEEMLEGLNLHDLFNPENGTVESLDKCEMTFVCTNDWPFGIDGYLIPVMDVDGKPVELDDPRKETHHSFKLSPKTKNATITISYDNNDMDLLRKADKVMLKLSAKTDLKDATNIKADTKLSMEVSAALLGKFLINNF